MQILDRLFGPQTRNYEKALDRTTMRNSLLSENLANVNVPGYKRKDVDFGIELEKAEGVQTSQFDNLRNQFGSKPFSSQGSVRIDGNSVDMEQEVVSMGETELRYEMLSQMTSNYFTNLKSVIKEGR